MGVRSFKVREQVFANLALGLRPSGNVQCLLSLFFPKFQDGRAPQVVLFFPPPVVWAAPAR